MLPLSESLTYESPDCCSLVHSSSRCWMPGLVCGRYGADENGHVLHAEFAGGARYGRPLQAARRAEAAHAECGELPGMADFQRGCELPDRVVGVGSGVGARAGAKAGQVGCTSVGAQSVG